jgi:hypothetical protein
MNETVATTNQKLVAGVLSAGAFVGCLLYGVKRNHPWIGFFVGLSAAGVVNMGAYAAMGAKMPEMASGERTTVIAQTSGGGAVAVSTPTPTEDPTATTTATRT